MLFRSSLRVEEDLGMLNTIFVCAGEVIVCQGLEVGGCQENGHADVVVVEKVIEGGEAFVARFERGGGGEGGVVGGKFDVICRC